MLNVIMPSAVVLSVTIVFLVKVEKVLLERISVIDLNR